MDNCFQEQLIIYGKDEDARTLPSRQSPSIEAFTQIRNHAKNTDCHIIPNYLKKGKSETPL